MKVPTSSCWALAVLTAAFLFDGAASAQMTTSYFWVVASERNAHVPKESFVIAVDAEMATQIRDIMSLPAGLAGFSGHIASGSVDYDRDYYAPEHPVWNWHVASVDEIFNLTGAIFPQCECPSLVANPSEIAANPDDWIARNGEVYTPIRYQIAAEIDPTKPSAVANVSNRAFTGPGEKTAITGFIVTGGQPQNLVVRGLGPSLTQSGIQQVVTNPQIEVFAGSMSIAKNMDWKSDAGSSIITTSYSVLAPSNDKESALYLTLLPGAYTIATTNEDSGDGIVLTEVFAVGSEP